MFRTELLLFLLVPTITLVFQNFLAILAYLLLIRILALLPHDPQSEVAIFLGLTLTE